MIKEIKIRDALKSVYELYSEVHDFIFTTYNYEPDFFDEHIVAYLMGFDRKIQTIGELKDADAWIRNNHLSVYYDKNAVSVGSSCLTVPVFPQNVKTGVFHPKVIVIYGRRKDGKKESAHLFVSSCNLTVSGYGRNMEGFGCVEVKSMQLSQSLLGFIDSLENNENMHLELKEFLNNRKIKDDDTEFVWTNSGSGKKMIDYLRQCPKGNLTIISPYFDENGPKNLLDDLLNRTKTTIVPAIDCNSYNLYKKDYEDLKDEGVCFSELNDAESRFVHAKVIQFGNRLIVGSYNFTTAAMRGKNAEAALVFSNIGDLKLKLKAISEENLLLDEDHISNRDERFVEEKSLFVSASVYWKEFKIRISSIGLKRNKRYLFRFDGLSKSWVLEDELEMEASTEIANHLLKHKSFSVFCSDNGKVCFNGLINELDAGEYRPELSCENLNESIREWFAYSDDNKNDRKPDLRLINPDDEDTEKALGVASKDTSDVFDNYYLVARSFENLLNQIKKARNNSLENAPKTKRKTEKYRQRYKEWMQRKQMADQDLFGYLVTKPGSVQNIVNFLQKDCLDRENKDIVYEWLVASYVDSVINLLPKKKVLSLNNDDESNNGRKLYKIKIEAISRQLHKIEKSINKIVQKRVDRKYFKWIVSEFKKRNYNV